MKRIAVTMAAAVIALSVAGCNEKNGNDDSAVLSSAAESGTENGGLNSDNSISSNSVSDDPIENAEYVVSQYMKYANLEFDESMLKLMTSDMQEQYKDTMENQGHDHGYDDNEEDMLTDVSFTADRDNSEILESVNIKDEYLTAVELTGSVNYKNKGEEASDSAYAIVIETPEHEWKIAYAGTKSQAYLVGIIADEESDKADSNAKAVYEAAEKACKKLDGEYEFKYLNYISTENDDFVNEIKSDLSDELEDTYFTVFMDGSKLDYVLWAENMSSTTVGRYPKDNG